VKPALFLRIASILTLIHCVLHTIGGVFGSPQHGTEEFEVIEAMKYHRFDFFGSMRGYWDFFIGYGLFISIILLIAAVLFWRLAAFVTTSPALVRSVAAIFAVNFLGMTIVSWKYFFLPPAVFELLIAVCLIVAFLGVGRQSASA
jgi:hypothetical protein